MQLMIAATRTDLLSRSEHPPRAHDCMELRPSANIRDRLL